ncbi:Peptidase family M23 [Microbacterium sp. cf046]|uniref:M23 family metallopeptidase n=1 Tax=Microbacterium sp. cf046 TaxID=1761803 RepID=UPI0008E280CA|nr:M23 family metallopeptidase [Microbacterium sp. cf046]SFR93687.1 Peptidase family M23 [Microbacterium sp. cf046]
MAYIRPVGDIFISDSWQGHIDRPTPSTEPGVDYGCGSGTAVHAPADAVIVETHDSPSGGGGRTIMLRTGGDWHRALHLSEIHVREGQSVRQGDVIGLSGASANGSETFFGPHLHWTFWRARGEDNPPVPGISGTDDFERFVGLNRTGPAGFAMEDDMFNDEDRALLTTVRNAIMNTHAGIWSGGRATIDGQVSVFNYGVLPIVAHNQNLIARLSGQVAALQEVVNQLTSTNNVVLDQGAIDDAATRGEDFARGGLTNEVVTNEPDVP